MKYRKQPIEIEARQLAADNVDDLATWCGGHASGGGTVDIPTLEGTMTARPGDWIIRGVQGEFYPCKPDIFAATYAAAESGNRQTAPDPHDLFDLVSGCRYRPGWDVSLADIDRGQGSSGLTLIITTLGFNCQPPGTLVTRVIGTRRPTRGLPAQSEQVPIEQIGPGDLVVSYISRYSTFRVRGAAVLRTGQRPFHGDLITVKAGSMASRYTPNHRCVVRMGEAFAGKHLVYLMRRGVNFRIGRCAGQYRQMSSTGIKAKLGVVQRAYTESADAAWVLGVYDTAAEAALAEALLSVNAGLPLMTFRASNKLGVHLSQETVDAFWLKMGDQRVLAAAVLAGIGKHIDYPLWTPLAGTKFGDRYTATLDACNLETGMRTIPWVGQPRAAITDSLPISVSRERYDGPVYSLDVDQEHTYIADGLVTHNSYHPERGETYRVNHYFPVPPAAYNRQSWQRWLFEQYQLVERHECMEFFTIDGVKPYAPNHGEGFDPYVVRELNTREAQRTSFRNELNPE